MLERVRKTGLAEEQSRFHVQPGGTLRCFRSPGRRGRPDPPGVLLQDRGVRAVRPTIVRPWGRARPQNTCSGWPADLIPVLGENRNPGAVGSGRHAVALEAGSTGRILNKVFRPRSAAGQEGPGARPRFSAETPAWRPWRWTLRKRSSTDCPTARSQVIGASDTSEKTARPIVPRCPFGHCQQPVLGSRRLWRELGGRAIHFDEWGRVSRLDIIISSTSAPTSSWIFPDSSACWCTSARLARCCWWIWRCRGTLIPR